MSKTKTEPTRRTYIEDAKNPVEVLPPSGDRLLVILRVQKSRDCTSFAHLDDLPLDLGQSPAIVTSVSGSPGIRIDTPTYPVS